MWIYGFAGFWIRGFAGSWVSGSMGLRIVDSGVRGFGGLWIHEFAGSRIHGFALVPPLLWDIVPPTLILPHTMLSAQSTDTWKSMHATQKSPVHVHPSVHPSFLASSCPATNTSMSQHSIHQASKGPRVAWFCSLVAPERAFECVLVFENTVRKRSTHATHATDTTVTTVRVTIQPYTTNHNTTLTHTKHTCKHT